MIRDRYVWFVVIGLLIFVGIRIHNLDAIPLFIDESISIERSQNIVDGTYIEHARTGKFLLPYVSLPYQPTIVALWSARLSLILLTCLTVASAFAIARRYGGVHAGLITLLLLTFSPMLFFFDRFVLSDTLLHITLTLWIFSLFRCFDRTHPRLFDGMVSGGLFVIAMLAKAPALFLLPLPIIVALFIPRWNLISRGRLLVTSYMTSLILWLPFAYVLSTRKIDYFGKSDHIAPSLNTLFDFDRILRNGSFYLEGIMTYHGILFCIIILLTIIIALRYKPRPLFVLSAGFVGYGVALVLLGGYGLFMRYYVPLLPMLFIAVGIASVSIIRAIQPRLINGLYVLLALWIALQSLPFINQMYTQPTELPLIAEDRNEYIRANSSGFGIVELADDLITRSQDTALVVEGAFVGCYTLVLSIPSDTQLTVQCPNVLSGDRRARYLNDYLPIEVEKYDTYYIVFETEGIVSPDEINSITLELIATYPRPATGELQLYQARATNNSED